MKYKNIFVNQNFRYDINSVPSFIIYDGKGKLVSEGDEAYDKVINMINE